MTFPAQAGKTILFHVLRFGFRLVPMRHATRDRMREWFLDRYWALVPRGPRGRIDPAAVPCMRVRADEPAIGHVAYRQEPLPSPMPATLVAFYLPQFHPIAENDAWWGKGFTEWRNVTRALPQFHGHAQPRLPADLGFYDLRNVDTMRDQVKLATEYGVGAFCFYFYWFSGKTLLEQPLRQWLDDPTLQLPFCLCWANETWSRRWDGRSEEILIAQKHSAEDDIAFIAHVAPYLRDPRYLRVDGKPLLLVYRPHLLPDAKQTTSRWRDWCRANAIGEIHLAYVQGFERPDPRDIGFDAAVEFPPNLSTPTNVTAGQQLLNRDFEGQVVDWREVASDYESRGLPAYRLYPGVNVGWDNEPRRSGKGRVYAHASPRRYCDWLQKTIAYRLADMPSTERMVFINAWNEWAEGAVLEPDTSLGHAWLEATRQALQRAAISSQPIVTTPKRPCVVVHAWYLDVLDEILAALQATAMDWRLVITTTADKAAAVAACVLRHGMQAEIEPLENRGRDVLPFLHVANRLIDEGQGVVLKLHTKHSPHRHDGDHWRRELLALLLSRDRATSIVQAFDGDPTLAMVAPDGHVQPLSYYWGANEDNVRSLANRLGIAAPQPDSDTFVSGSMFWLRLTALHPLLDAHLQPGEFEPEAAQLDGTLAHAIERIFALCIRDQGLRIESVTTICGEPSSLSPALYPYAKRG